MKTHRKLILLLLVLCLMLSIGVVAYAATNGFTMSYQPGTSDTVTNMPDDDGGTGGTPYTVSQTVPQREGYVFLGWKLDYELDQTYTLTYHVAGDPNYSNALPGDSVTPGMVTDIAEGGSVTLANAPTTAWASLDGSDPTTAKETYEVLYLELGTWRWLAPQKVVTDQTIGSTVPEQAIDIDGYTVVGDDTQDFIIKQSTTGQWTFTGWCSDEACTTPITVVTNITADMDVYGKWTYETIDLAKNEITFYYEELPEVKYVSYTVRYIDVDTGDMIAPDGIESGIEGEIVTVYYKEIENYTPLNLYIQWEVEDNGIIIYEYYRNYGPELDM